MAFIETAREAIEARLLANWPAVGTGDELRTPVALETVDKAIGLLTNSAGTETISKPPEKAAWVRLTVRMSAGFQKDMAGVPRVRQAGNIYLDVFAPLTPGAGVTDYGRDGADQLADLLLLIFDRKEFSSVKCWAASVEERGQDGGWFWEQVRVPFTIERLSA